MTKLPKVYPWSDELEPVTAGHRSRRDIDAFEGVVAVTVAVLRQQINDLWVCNNCLAIAEDRAAEMSLLGERPPLEHGETPLEQLHWLEGAEKFSGFYSRRDWDEAVESALSRAGDAQAICEQAAFHAWSAGNHRIHNFLRAPRKSHGLEVVSIGYMVYIGSLGNDPGPAERVSISRAKIDVDERGRWIILADSVRAGSPPWSELVFNEDLAFQVGLKVLRGIYDGECHKRNRYASGREARFSPYMRFSHQPEPNLEAVTAGQRLISPDENTDQ